MILLLLGCPPPGEAEPVLADIEAAVFAPSCAGAGCHDEATAAGDLWLAGDGLHDALLDEPCSNGDAVARGLMRVVPGDPDRSYLYLKVVDPDGMGDPMPPWGPIEEANIALIEAWIAAGAPE